LIALFVEAGLEASDPLIDEVVAKLEFLANLFHTTETIEDREQQHEADDEEQEDQSCHGWGGAGAGWRGSWRRVNFRTDAGIPINGNESMLKDSPAFIGGD
jgi:hypothetical protein